MNTAADFGSTIGRPPGTLVYTGEMDQVPVSISTISYNEQTYNEYRPAPEDPFYFEGSESLNFWIQVEGLHDVALLKLIGERFNIHPLTLEDVANVDQRAKIEEHDDYLFCAFKLIHIDQCSGELATEQVALILKNNIVISFHEKTTDLFNHIKDRLKNAKGKIRKLGASYLFYILNDCIIDSYFPVVEKFRNDFDQIEETISDNPDQEIFSKVHEVRKKVTSLKRHILPVKEISNHLYKSDSDFFDPSISPYLKDLQDHTVQIVEDIGLLAESSANLLELHVQINSFKMNQVIKGLTIIATIFMPLTFIAGVYGMNFSFMPELHWKYGYFFSLAMMLIVTIVLALYIRKKKWT